jgi:type I restriction enzyme S subunit
MSKNHFYYNFLFFFFFFYVIKINLPLLQEQQKIANTLSTLDNLIEAQNQKITQLKQHKKGLMQQLFVSSEVAHE